jgi:hypothetical protein
MTKREQEALLRKLARAKNAVHEVDVALLAFAREDADDVLRALGHLIDAVKEAR